MGRGKLDKACCGRICRLNEHSHLAYSPYLIIPITCRRHIALSPTAFDNFLQPNKAFNLYFIMVFGRDKEKVTPAQAAADVRERYDEKINQYLRKVGAAGPAWLPDFDLLGRLFSWGEKVLDERNNLRSQLSSAEKRFDVERKRLHSQLSQVEEKFDVERIQFQGRLSQAEQTIQVDRKRFQGQFTSAEENNANEQNKLQRQLADAKGRIRELAADLASAQRIIASNESEKETIESQYQEELESLKNKYSTVTKKEKDIHGREVKKLVGQLLVNQDDNVGWTDDKLKFRFQQLQSSIISLVSPRHKEYRISTDSMVTLDLDPTGFLTRTNKSNTHYLLQSIIWRILYDRFFSTPFGLGVLGDGKGQEKLLDLVFAWIEFLGGTSRHSMLVTKSDELY